MFSYVSSRLKVHDLLINASLNVLNYSYFSCRETKDPQEGREAGEHMENVVHQEHPLHREELEEMVMYVCRISISKILLKHCKS